jgi:3D (Asp-Asp-Asp) domain-containing protein
MLTGALLLTSLAFNVHPSVAENLASLELTQQTQEKSNPAGTSLSGEAVASATKVSAEAPKPETVAASKPGMSLAPPATGSTDAEAAPVVAAQSYTATAYSLSGRTASGATVRRGFIAADHHVLPLGSRVRVEAGSYTGEYLVADRGSAVRGRIIDIWVPSTHEAMRFGRRPVRLTVLSYGARPAARARATRR